jgi:hypothetical protein
VTSVATWSLRLRPVWGARPPGRPLAQPGLDVHVDVFEGRVEPEGSVGHLASDRLEPREQRPLVGLADEALLAQHPHVGDRRAHVVRGQRPVEVDRR